MIVRLKKGLSVPSLTTGSTYDVLGVSVYEDSVRLLVCNDEKIPDWPELSNFEIDDPEIHAGWLIKEFITEGLPLQILLGYPELIEDEAHYDALIEGDEEALRIFHLRSRQTYGELIVPDADDFMSNFGVGVDDPGAEVRHPITIDAGHGGTIRLQWNAPDRTISFEWQRGGAKILEMTKSDVWSMEIEATTERSGIILRHGDMRRPRKTYIQVYPDVLVVDR